MYKLIFSRLAVIGIDKLRKSEPANYKKLNKLLDELRTHPYLGTGHPERLKGTELPLWSRRITSRHRLVYTIEEDRLEVLLLSAYGHYDDR